MEKFRVKVLINVYFVYVLPVYGGHYVCNSNFHYFHTSDWLKSPPALSPCLRPNGVFIYLFTKRMALVGFEEAIHTIFNIPLTNNNNISNYNTILDINI